MKRMLTIGFIIGALLLVGFGIVCLNGAFGKREGNVFSLTNFDAQTKAVLGKCLRFSTPNEIQFKHASMLGGKDWTLYVCLDASKSDWERLLKSMPFTTRKGRETEVPLEMSAIPWWKIDKEEVDSILCATEGYTGMIILNENEMCRVFIYTDGGPSGFPHGVWGLFKSQR
jgi:hypothetical protein